MISPAKIYVRFADIDSMGHVNNAIYLNYFETARMHYFGELLGEKWDWNTNGIILLRNEIDYVKPVLLNMEPLITITVEHIGNKSFRLGYVLEVKGEVFTKGTSTLVSFDYNNKQAMEIPQVMKEVLLKLKEEQ